MRVAFRQVGVELPRHGSCCATGWQPAGHTSVTGVFDHERGVNDQNESPGTSPGGVRAVLVVAG